MTLLIGQVPKSGLVAPLKGPGLVFELGPFRARIRARYPALADHIRACYGHVPMLDDATPFVHQSVTLDAPNWLRRLIRSQVVAHTSPQMPMVPLPDIHSPLAFEMALNFAVATGWYRHLLLHAGVVASQEGALVISGASGAGKSTLTAALAASGMRLLSDEFGFVMLGGRQLIGYPRPISFKNESIAVAQELFGKARVSTLLRATPKGRLAYVGPESAWVEHALKPVTPRAILFPHFSKSAKPRFAPVEKSIALTRLNAASPNIQITGEKGFQSLIALVEETPAFDLFYGSTDQSLTLVDHIVAATPQTGGADD